MPLRHRVTLVVSFGPSPTPVLDVAVEHARRHADALEHLGRTYRATYVLGHDAVHLGRALQLLRMVKGWRATTVEVDGDPEDRAVALAMLTCSREWLGRQGRCRAPFPAGAPPKCRICPLYEPEWALESWVRPEWDPTERDLGTIWAVPDHVPEDWT